MPDAKIRPDEITIDKDGKVIITNPSFSSKVAGELKKIKDSGGKVDTKFITIDLIC
jgi:hypothetical protein